MDRSSSVVLPRRRGSPEGASADLQLGRTAHQRSVLVAIVQEAFFLSSPDGP
jgi:hypothetical protein